MDGVDAPDRTAALCDLYQVLFNGGMIGSLTVPDFCAPSMLGEPLALAYINVDGADGYSQKGGDALIAGLFDTNSDGVPSIGDRVLYGVYPTDLSANSTGAFANPQVGPVTNVVSYISGAEIGVDVGSVQFIWSTINSDVEVFIERDISAPGSIPPNIQMLDYLVSTGDEPDEDLLAVRSSSIGMPVLTSVVDFVGVSTVDDNFIDVDIIN
jgi:hypothetical protein